MSAHVLRFTSRAIVPGLLLGLSAFAGESVADPAVGRWSGTLQRGADRAEFGIEIRADATGELSVESYLPAGYMMASPLGRLVRENGRYRCADQPLEFTLNEGRVTGTLAGELTVSLTRSGKLPELPVTASVPTGPAPLWDYQADAAFWATPAVANGVAYVASADGVLHAIGIADGQRRWTHSLDAPAYGAALVTSDRIYVVNDAGTLFALDRGTGAERWKFDLGGRSVERHLPSGEPPYAYDYQAPTPALADGVIYVAGTAGDCHALQATDGKPLWHQAVGGNIRTSAGVSGEVVVFGSLNQFVYALDRRTGAMRWKTDARGPVTTAPVIAGRNVVVGTRGARLIALDLATGRFTWDRFQWFSWVESAPQVVDATLYLGSSDNRTVRALAAGDGGTLWSTDVGGWAWATPAVDARTVFASVCGPSEYFLKPTPEGSLVALDRATGRLKWRRPARSTGKTYLGGFVGAPVIAADRVVVAGLDGHLLALPTGSNPGTDLRVN